METTPDKSISTHSSHEEYLKHLFEGKTFKFPHFNHEKQPSVVNVNAVVDEKISKGDKIADNVAAYVGSWRFVIVMSTLLAGWIIWNSLPFLPHFDLFPFILLNLLLSFIAGYTGPFIMMSQNRQSSKDRLMAENDYTTDVKGEQEICHILDHLDHQDALILEVVKRLELQNQRIDQQDQLILQLVQKIDTQQQFMKEQHLDILQRLDTLQKLKVPTEKKDVARRRANVKEE